MIQVACSCSVEDFGAAVVSYVQRDWFNSWEQPSPQSFTFCDLRRHVTLWFLSLGMASHGTNDYTLGNCFPNPIHLKPLPMSQLIGIEINCWLSVPLQKSCIRLVNSQREEINSAGILDLTTRCHNLNRAHFCRGGNQALDMKIIDISHITSSFCLGLRLRQPLRFWKLSDIMSKWFHWISNIQICTLLLGWSPAHIYRA